MADNWTFGSGDVHNSAYFLYLLLYIFSHSLLLSFQNSMIHAHAGLGQMKLTNTANLCKIKLSFYWKNDTSGILLLGMWLN